MPQAKHYIFILWMAFTAIIITQSYVGWLLLMLDMFLEEDKVWWDLPNKILKIED